MVLIQNAPKNPENSQRNLLHPQSEHKTTQKTNQETKTTLDTKQKQQEKNQETKTLAKPLENPTHPHQCHGQSDFIPLTGLTANINSSANLP